ncbi:MAG: hypothetical protein OXI83_07195 [Gemmatimonadota bacterium]|nr:hypothetical protein [Gemmatimonadota bacterium]
MAPQYSWWYMTSSSGRARVAMSASSTVEVCDAAWYLCHTDGRVRNASAE